MTTNKIVTFIIVLALIAAAAVYFCISVFQTNKTEPSPTPTATAAPTPYTTSKIRVDSPLPGSFVASPLVVRGEAVGNWYFEASFPVRLYDANGKELLAIPAQAQGEWMTTDFVPFEVTLTFDTPETDTGTLVLQKDNPSGLPQYEEEIRFQVRFR